MKEQNQKRIEPRENPIRTREAALELCLAFPGTFREQPYHDPNWDAVGLARKRKFFAFVFQKDGQIWINLKMAGRVPLCPACLPHEQRTLEQCNPGRLRSQWGAPENGCRKL